MPNRNQGGPGPYGPDFLRIAPSDTISFLPMAPGHNAAPIDGMIPNELPGFDSIKCTPHPPMEMVMIIQVGDVPLAKDFISAAVPQSAR